MGEYDDRLGSLQTEGIENTVTEEPTKMSSIAVTDENDTAAGATEVSIQPTGTTEEAPNTEVSVNDTVFAEELATETEGESPEE